MFLNRLVHGAMGCGQKKLLVCVTVPPAPVRVPSHLSRVSRQLRRSLMIRVIIKWSWGLCTDLLAFALQPRKTPENLSQETLWWSGCATSYRLKLGPFLQMKSVGSHSMSRREKEGKKDWTGKYRDVLSMEPWAAAEKTFSYFGGATISCPGS